ncbi:hypothetical protein IFR05_008039, partial [Cadophora sp. M221]
YLALKAVPSTRPYLLTKGETSTMRICLTPLNRLLRNLGRYSGSSYPTPSSATVESWRLGCCKSSSTNTSTTTSFQRLRHTAS